jgi:hypothetical protein
VNPPVVELAIWLPSLCHQPSKVLRHGALPFLPGQVPSSICTYAVTLPIQSRLELQ